MDDLTLAPVTDPLEIYRYRDGLYAVDLLTAAVVDLDFFSWLGAHPSSQEEICTHFGIADRPTDVMLTLFAANRLVERVDGVVHATLMAREHLASTSPWNLAPYYAALRDRPLVRDFIQVLRTDAPGGWGGGQAQLDWHKAMETETFAKAFTAAMDCRGRYLGQSLARAVDLNARHKLLDIGGGSGIYACALCARHPHLRATVFDQPPVDRLAKSGVEAYGFSGRITVTAGDMFTDALPIDCDVHLFSNVLHDWGPADIRRLFAISRRALPAGGLLIIHDAFINADKTGPLAVAEYSALLMHSTRGKCYSTAEYGAFLVEAGFAPGDYRETAADRGVMTATAI